MEELLKELEEYKEHLQEQAKGLMERIVRINAAVQNSSVRDFSKSLTDAHGSNNTKIDLIEYQIKDLKRKIKKQREILEDEA